MEVIPAPADTGIVFERVDLPGTPSIKAVASQITSTELSTTIGQGAVTVSTIEHLMAAFAGLGIENAIVRVDANELPIMDGSAAPFVEGLIAAGLSKVDGFRRVFVVKKAFEVRDGDRLVRVEPADVTSFDCEVEYRSAAIGRQTLDVELTPSRFLDLCGARTFCHLGEVEAMRAQGLALGGSLENAVVVTDTSVVNSDGLRYADEAVRHKILDCIGDLALLGAPLIGRITLVKNGHGLHARFMKELLARRDELLAVVEVGAFREAGRRPALPDAVQAMVASAAVDG